MNHEIDAQGKSLGRVATEAAHFLMGKHSPDFAKHTVSDTKVVIKNASKLHITEARSKKVYTRYSGYPGGLKKETLANVLDKKGHKEALMRAVRGMLPGNRLRDPRLKNLVIEE